jgi:hypothetical protein
MNHDTFIDTFEEMGFDVAEQPAPEDVSRGIIVASNDSGDELCWSVIDHPTKPEKWGVYVDPARASLDDPTFGWEELTFEDNAVVLDGVSGTRTKDFGYGRASFDGRAVIDHLGMTITETTSTRL